MGSVDNEYVCEYVACIGDFTGVGFCLVVKDCG